MKHMLLIPADLAEPHMVEADTLEQMQAHVGGWLEETRLADNWWLLFDEEGLMKDKPVNDVASLLYGYRTHGRAIVGDALLARTDPANVTEFADITEDEARTWMQQTLKVSER